MCKQGFKHIKLAPNGEPHRSSTLLLVFYIAMCLEFSQILFKKAVTGRQCCLFITHVVNSGGWGGQVAGKDKSLG